MNFYKTLFPHAMSSPLIIKWCPNCPSYDLSVHYSTKDSEFELCFRERHATFAGGRVELASQLLKLGFKFDKRKCGGLRPVAFISSHKREIKIDFDQASEVSCEDIF